MDWISLSVDSISLSASIADNHHTYESVADPGFWGSVPIPRCHAEGSAEVRRYVRAKRGKKSPSFFTFQDGLSWHIYALHCYLVHDIVLNFDDDGNLRTTKSIQKVMKSEARLVLLASYTTYPA